MISAPALKYNGGKFRLRKWILSHFPEQSSYNTYVELSSGAASVLLSKNPSKVEILNDLDGNITNFFNVLRTVPKELIRRIQYTPYSEQVLNTCLESIEGELNPIERAYKYYCICWMSIRANDIRKSSVNFRARGNRVGEGGHNPVNLFSRIRHLYQISKRLKNVLILQRDALSLIAPFDSDNTLFYLDLPYLSETRSAKKLYTLEFGSEFQHKPILEALSRIKGKAIISHYNHPLYDEILSGWRKETIQTLSNRMAKCYSGDEKKRTEVLYMNF